MPTSLHKICKGFEINSVSFEVFLDHNRGVFKIMSQLHNGAFCENSQRLTISTKRFILVV